MRFQAIGFHGGKVVALHNMKYGGEPVFFAGEVYVVQPHNALGLHISTDSADTWNEIIYVNKGGWNQCYAKGFDYECDVSDEERFLLKLGAGE